MATARLTRKLRFCAAHRYERPEWSDEENRRVFGRCNYPHGHGHNYLLEVTVTGAIDPLTGFVIDLGELDRLLEREVVERLDHRHMNHEIAEFAAGRSVPTSENIAAWLWSRIEPALPDGVTLRRLRLHEEESFYVDYFGGGDGE